MRTSAHGGERDIERLNAAISRAIARHEDDETIYPEVIAATVMSMIDQQLKETAANLQIRQLTRAMLRHAYDPDEDERKRRKREPSLPGLPLVQDRYPRMPPGRGYVKREALSKEDAKGNLRRLRGKGGKILEHASQFEQWCLSWYDDWSDDDAAEEAAK